MAGTQPAADPGGAAPPPAPANGQDNAPQFTVTDARSAGDAIAGLLFAGDDDAPPAREPAGDQPQSGGDKPPDTGADESRPTGDEDDKGSGEPAAPPAIEPPVSWTEEERGAFRQLPPELQQTVVRRESQREAVLTQRSQEAAEARNAYSAERQAAVAQRVEYLQGLQKMMVLAAPEAAALENIDWVATQAQSPAEFTRLQALREGMRYRLGQIDAHFQQQQQQLAAVQQQQLAELVGKETRALNERWPDFADEAKGPTLRKELSTYLGNGGFTPQELDTAYDHRLVVLATKAMLYDRQHQLAAAADAKRNNTAPQVRPPGNSREGDRGPQGRMRDKVNKLGRTNSVRDAGSLIAELL